MESTTINSFFNRVYSFDQYGYPQFEAQLNDFNPQNVWQSPPLMITQFAPVYAVAQDNDTWPGSEPSVFNSAVLRRQPEPIIEVGQEDDVIDIDKHIVDVCRLRPTEMHMAYMHYLKKCKGETLYDMAKEICPDTDMKCAGGVKQKLMAISCQLLASSDLRDLVELMYERGYTPDVRWAVTGIPTSLKPSNELEYLKSRGAKDHPYISNLEWISLQDVGLSERVLLYFYFKKEFGAELDVNQLSKCVEDEYFLENRVTRLSRTLGRVSKILESNPDLSNLAKLIIGGGYIPDFDFGLSKNGLKRLKPRIQIVLK